MLLFLCFTVEVLQRMTYDLASPLLIPHSSSPLALWFPPIAPLTSFFQGHLFIRITAPPSLCHPCPLQHLRLFSSFLRVATCILMTLNPPCFSAFSTGASCTFGELGLHAAFSLPLLMGAHLFLDLASAGNQLTALGLIFLCLQNSISQGHRLPAGHLELNILFYLFCMSKTELSPP